STTVTAHCGDHSMLTPFNPPGIVERSSRSSRSERSRGRMACVSGSPKRTLNSSTRGPSAVIISPAYRTPWKATPRRLSSSNTGWCTAAQSSAARPEPIAGTGEYEPIPPVLGPRAGPRVGVHGVGRRRHPGGRPYRLATRLGALELGRGGTGTKAADPGLAQRIGHSGDQRRLGADHDLIGRGPAGRHQDRRTV